MPNSQAVRTTDKLEMFMSFPRENQKILLATNLRAKKKRRKQHQQKETSSSSSSPPLQLSSSFVSLCPCLRLSLSVVLNYLSISNLVLSLSLSPLVLPLRSNSADLSYLFCACLNLSIYQSLTSFIVFLFVLLLVLFSAPTL
jgi:hypothetical protein